MLSLTRTLALLPTLRRSDAPTLRRSDANGVTSARFAVKAIAALSLGCFPILSASAQTVFNLPAAFVPSNSIIGPSFVVPTTLTSTDVLRAVVSGTVDFDSPNANNYSADWNAAGVVVRSRSSALVVGGSEPLLINIGWYRLAIGNDSLGFFPLFEPNAENGFGSSNPPEVLTLNRPVSSVFTSLGFTSIPAGTVLRYRIFDNPTSDNSGGFTVSTSAVAAPEPSVLALLGLVGAPFMAGIMRRRK